ncbi:hypothetical protein [Streptomyces hawaiiensis]|uniref:hypothetical protein n=1 Tax=Streptomyces hawaiiensis TaxID=67305 RepID=UPI001586DC69|nr:hypothetical protein [Streptomyces hawaiiensis]
MLEEPVAYDVLLSGAGGLAGVVRSADGGTPVAEAVVIVTDVRGEVPATGRTRWVSSRSPTWCRGR